MGGIGRTDDGRPILTGTYCLPPVDEQADALKQTRSRTGEAKRKTRDRFDTLNAFVDCSMKGLSKAELATWFVLYRDTKNGTACTAQTDIARRAGLSVRAIRYAVQRLVECGLLIVVYQGGLKRGPTRFRVEPLRKLASSSKRQKDVSD